MNGSPIARGAWLAAFAALAFGVVTPLIQRAGHGLGPFTTAALLYAGAAAATLGTSRDRAREAPLRTAQLPRLLAVALFGAVVAPAALAFGLQRTGAATASLLLNLEAVFTAGLAWLVYREPIGGRVLVALLAMTAGGALLVASGALSSTFIGPLAVVAATLGWALDNTLTRPLAEVNPAEVVRYKGLLGAAVSLAIGLAAREPLPSPSAALALLACGATGYGLSLRLYLSAQRAIGAARTGSIFALAPFVGAVVAFAMGDRIATPFALASAVLFALGLYLHITERHAHAHTHAPVAHEHAHRHDDAHHDHAHDPPFAGEHSHPHRHERTTHSHDHGPDAHHRHEHD